MRYNWLPWKYVLRRMARTGGFVDPVALLAQFNKFAQPSEVAAPVELLRAGMIFHARGLMNARTIQGNLDWVWPFWVRRQFDPLDDAFVPRSFALTQVNLTNRNWTAVGLPGHAAYPIVDPRGLVTPFYDGWSLDAWIVTADGDALVPPHSPPPRQVQLNEPERLAVETEFQSAGMHLKSEVWVLRQNGEPVCRVRYSAVSEKAGVFVVSIRPFNPEGVSFVYRVGVDASRSRWTVNDKGEIRLDPPMDRHLASEYRQGDVYSRLRHREETARKACDIGMASAAAVYRLRPHEPLAVTVDVPLAENPQAEAAPISHAAGLSWEQSLHGACRIEIPDARMQYLYDSAVRTLILLSPLEIYPGPFYYKRFWFRDAVFILNALLSLGMSKRAGEAIDHSLGRQTLAGYFESQKGEWDSNGQVLWILNRFREVTGNSLPGRWLKAARRGARWILRKRLPAGAGRFCGGLLPAGFSAEHLGNNDFYYWDDFWGISGLEAAAALCKTAGAARHAELFRLGAEHFSLCVERSLAHSRRIRNRDAIPASPYRRMDAGAVGSIVVGYPLRLWPRREPRLLETLNFLLENCCIDHAFYQEITHSGFNIYLTLHCAQCLLRAGDPRYLPMVERVAKLASPTGHWPEAIHPRTLGGCMGDGQHAWAAAEWVMMLHNMFAVEEGDRLILLQGIPQRWLEKNVPLAIGPIRTRFGPLRMTVGPREQDVTVEWESRWHSPPAALSFRLPGYAPIELEEPEPSGGRMRLQPDSRASK